MEPTYHDNTPLDPGSGPRHFDIQALIIKSWIIFTLNPVPFVGAVFISFVACAIVNRATAMLHLSALGFVLAPLVVGPLAVGVARMAISAARGLTPDMAELRVGFDKFGKSYLANLLITLGIVIGGMLFVLPGLFVIVLYSPTYLFIADTNMPLWDSLEASRKMVMANLVPWIFLTIAIIALNVAGFIACIVGLFISIPVSAILLAIAWDLERLHVPTVSVTTPPPSFDL